MDMNYSVREYDRYIKQKYQDVLRAGQTTATNELEYWEEITRPKIEPCLKPVLNCNGEPIQYDGTMVEFSR